MADRSPDDDGALRTELTFTVTAADTAQALGSGDLPVLGTPRLLAWCEAATCAAVAPSADVGRTTLGTRAQLEHRTTVGTRVELEHRTTVGTRVELEHRAACAVGSVVHVVADLVHVDGRLLRFSVAASADDGRLLATGEITRVAVDRERFLARVPPA